MLVLTTVTKVMFSRPGIIEILPPTGECKICPFKINEQ